jgi:hypothetical protein
MDRSRISNNKNNNIELNMATYKEIFGTNIEVLASDPANPVEGQVWYNSTDNVVKGFALTTAGSWATATSINTARRTLGTSVQSPVSSVLAYGGNNPGGAVEGETEQYNGTTWTELADLNTARGSGSGGGTNTAALYTGGYLGPPGSTGVVESWNGSSWAEVADLNTARYSSGGGVGSNTANLIIGGLSTPPTTVHGQVEQWNGTSWTEVGDLNNSRYASGAAGESYTSAIVAAGGNPGFAEIANVETWNGTSWTETTDVNTARRGLGSGGTQTSAIAFGGTIPGTPEPVKTGATEIWNGTSWTEDTDLNTARDSSRSGGGITATSSAIAVAGGTDPGSVAAVEEWTGAGAPVTYTFTDS